MGYKVTVVMYHYVRDLQNSRYPAIKGLDIRLFKEQLKYFKRFYNNVTVEQVIEAVRGNSGLPEKSLMLTFDDAYMDHYSYAFPVLDEMRMQGVFFAPVKAIMNHEVLTVNKIHHVLAARDGNIDDLVKDIREMLKPYEGKDGVRTFDAYFSELAMANRFDCKEVIFIKRLLQVVLPLAVRSGIIDALFSKYVSDEEKSFSRELYMSEEQLRCMNRNGMVIGSHGYDHFWLNSLSRAGQETEISRSVDFLINNIGVNPQTLSIGYPYGAYNDDTLDIAWAKGFQLGFTTEVDVATLDKGNNARNMTLPRLDTNDFPKDGAADHNEWFTKG